MSPKLPVCGFEWVINTSYLKEDFIKPEMQIVIQDIFLKLIFNTQENCTKLRMIYYFYQKEKNLKKFKNLSTV